MTTIELLNKGTIEIEDDINFRTHADVLRLFGKDYKIYQGAAPEHPHEEGVRIWFPHFYQDDENEWENTWGLNEESVFERRKFDSEGYVDEIIARSDKHTRVLFAKIAPFGKAFYKFKGIYKFDPEISVKIRKCVYRRIATSARLYPSS